MFIMSSEDTVIRMCYENDPEFWQQWRNELDTIARTIIKEKPDTGLFLPNCPFHCGLFYNLTYQDLEVPFVDNESINEKGFLRDILVNFMNSEHPYQAIDDMAIRNPNCND